MSDTLKMFGRYAITAAVAWAAGRGLISSEAAGPLTNMLLELAAVIVAALPALWAARNIDNSPKT